MASSSANLDTPEEVPVVLEAPKTPAPVVKAPKAVDKVPTLVTPVESEVTPQDAVADATGAVDAPVTSHPDFPTADEQLLRREGQSIV
jgi:hypothetical protein